MESGPDAEDKGTSPGLAQHFISTCEGTLILAQANMDKARIAKAWGQFRNFLKINPPAFRP